MGMGSESKKIAWIKWKKLYRPKSEGGLGIKILALSIMLY